MKTLIVMPAYNEAGTLAAAVASLDVLSQDYELLIVNDGSHDQTAAQANELAKNANRRMFVAHLPTNSGVGAAVQTGYQFAAQRGYYTYVIQFDADGQHDAAYVPALVEACERDGLDLCIGSRFLDRTGRDFLSTPSRRVGIQLISWLISALLRVRITDPTGGFRCAGRRAWSSFARYYPEEYGEPESLFWCVRHGMKVAEIPVRMHARQGGVSSMHLSKEAYYMLKVSGSILIDRVRRRERWYCEA